MGRYHETSIHDDWDGVLHCTNKECNYEVRRYKSMDNFEPEPDRVVKLSPTDEQPSLKEQALEALKDIECKYVIGVTTSTIRRALEALPND
jgi:hypothetical protein